jgi:hypothetical protein
LVLLLCFCFFAFKDKVSVMGEFAAGVKGGDWVKYRYAFADTNPVTQAIWKKITIQTVDGPVVSGVVEKNLPGQPSSAQQFSLNITKRDSSPSIDDFFFIPANLTTGSIIPALNRTLTGTTMWLDR